VRQKEQKPKRPSGTKDKVWLPSLLFVLAFALAGWGIHALIGSLIPLWTLLGFSIVYSLEKWLNYPTIRHKNAGRIYRLILNLSVLSLLGLLIRSGILLFTQRFMQSPLVGSLVFVLELGVFIWLCTVISKNRWRQPSMKLTVLPLIGLFLIFSFAGVQPFADYMGAALDKIRIVWPDRPTPWTVILVLIVVGVIALTVDTIRRRRSPLRIGLTIIAVITTFLAVVGLFYYISPTLFITMMSSLPPSIQNAMFVDFLLRGGTGFWIFAIVSGVLWYVISRIR
jgi:hypothetical protein